MPSPMARWANRIRVLRVALRRRSAKKLADPASATHFLLQPSKFTMLPVLALLFLAAAFVEEAEVLLVDSSESEST